MIANGTGAPEQLVKEWECEAFVSLRSRVRILGLYFLESSFLFFSFSKTLNTNYNYDLKTEFDKENSNDSHPNPNSEQIQDHSFAFFVQNLCFGNSHNTTSQILK